MDYDWECRDIAQVVDGCSCGGANCGLRKGGTHRVNGVAPIDTASLVATGLPPKTVWLTFDTLPTLPDIPGWPSILFRKLRPATTDIFLLADTKAPRVTEDA